jgi:hypothetical protein
MISCYKAPLREQATADTEGRDCGVTQTSRIEDEITLLHRQLNEETAIIEQLYARLNPVLGPENSAAVPMEPGKDGYPRSSLLQQIEQARAVAEQHHSCLVALLHRLEL